MRVALVQCTSEKRDGRHPARDLYDESVYFGKQRQYAEAAADEWYIQSAEHGLVEPDDCLDAYDTHAKDIENRDEWAAGIATALATRVDLPATIEILGGSLYADPLTPELERLGCEVLEPFRGLGIGERMAALDQRTQEVAHAPLHG